MSDVVDVLAAAAAQSDPLVLLGWDAERERAFAPLAVGGALPGRVVRADRGSVVVMLRAGVVRAAPGRALQARADSGEALPTTGDWVAVVARVRHATDEIVAVLPRRSAFVRRDPGDRVAAQVVAANVDVVCIVYPAGEVNARRLEREVAAVRESGALPVVVLTKADLAEEAGEASAETVGATLGVPVHVVSAVEGRGLEAVRAYAAGNRTLAFIGASGVGKSTLVNALVGGEVMATGEVRASDGRGRHTTTARELVGLPEGGAILDTPGMRSMALWSAEAGLGETFADVEAVALECRFRDCGHAGEPGCAVAEALRSGRLDAARVEHMRLLERELAHVRLQQDEQARTERRKSMQAQGRSSRARKR